MCAMATAKRTDGSVVKPGDRLVDATWGTEAEFVSAETSRVSGQWAGTSGSYYPRVFDLVEPIED
ncbi:hypothetical protein BJF78_34670 [Pseudonocardia sp. CNS-139]|nr:hypothetical protein BJF78_34670 [Pseudonocardia sp. CNS-139]